MIDDEYLNEEEYQDGVTITPDEIYAWADANNTTPKTSAASMAEMMDAFQGMESLMGGMQPQDNSDEDDDEVEHADAGEVSLEALTESVTKT